MCDSVRETYPRVGDDVGAGVEGREEGVLVLSRRELLNELDCLRTLVAVLTESVVCACMRKTERERE